MEITHFTKNLPITSRKLRLVANTVKYKNATEALGLLNLLPNKGAHLMFKSLSSAIAMAKDNGTAVENLTIQRIMCNDGRTLKRMMGHSRGRMAMIMKKATHLSIVLSVADKPGVAKTVQKTKPSITKTTEEN